MFKFTLALALVFTACASPAIDKPLDPPPWPLGADNKTATGDMSKSQATQDAADKASSHQEDTDVAPDEPAKDEPNPDGDAPPKGEAPTTP
jgi:hypothetical protein